ncbi:hypothetical protein MKW94_018899 [Papaver nudicaule]|uniref:Cullin family profile domain-containing protein n=1 Tax=Papaver nudicaule TaxID=74823 RepID=A0AA41V3E1_PAPNU|nr:hypothetical protein [Papaver nudicaule]
MEIGTKIISLEEGWGVMEEGIAKMKRLVEGVPGEPQFNADLYMKLYTVIYNMCVQKPPHDVSDKIYGKYKETFEVYLRSRARPAIQQKHDVFMLQELVQRWKNHKVMVRWLSRFCFYLDRYYIPRKSLPSLDDTGKNCFREIIYEYLKVHLKNVVISLINQEREGVEIDRTMLKNALEIFVEMGANTVGGLGCYVDDFETAFITDTADYYSRKASAWIQEDSCPDYMIKAEECLKREKDRVTNYLHSSTEGKLLEEVQTHLLLNNAQRLFDKEQSGCTALLKDDKTSDLDRMYRLFSNIKNGLDPLSAAFKQHVTSEGMSIVKQVDDAVATSKKEDRAAAGLLEQSFVRRVIDLHDKYYAYVTGPFKKDSLFHKALKEAFEKFLNKSVGGSSVAELLAIFCDGILRKGGSTEKLSDDAIEETLDKIVVLLSYIDDKDLFAEFCKKKLARRLLFDKNSAEDEHERNFLSKLKLQCGGQFTSKMEGMITDLTVARENQSGYEEYVNSHDFAHPGMDFNITILTTGHWPTYKTIDLNLPTEMAQCVLSFKDYYQSKTKNRKLTYLYTLGSCNGLGKFQKKPVELILSTHQACLLMLFNSSDKLSYSEIRAQLNLTDDDVVRLLHSLSCAKYKILTKEPNTRSISQKDSFTWNADFTDKMRRIKVPLAPVDEKKKVIEDVDKDRRFAIDAAIVRIMKARKVLQYNDLVTTCVEQLSRMFKPDFKVIKKRIEDLISREFLARDEENPNTFKYLA